MTVAPSIMLTSGFHDFRRVLTIPTMNVHYIKPRSGHPFIYYHWSFSDLLRSDLILRFLKYRITVLVLNIPSIILTSYGDISDTFQSSRADICSYREDSRPIQDHCHHLS